MTGAIVTELAKREATLAAKAMLRCDATVNVTQDDRGARLYVVSWAGYTRQLRDLGEAERLIETLPRAGRFG